MVGLYSAALAALGSARAELAHAMTGGLVLLMTEADGTAVSDV